MHRSFCTVTFSGLLRRLAVCFPVVGLLAGSLAFGQGLTYDNQREVAVPDYATIRIGGFYSSWAISASTSYRYTTSSGSGTSFVFDNEIGEVRSDGSDFPLVVTLDTRNYAIITRNMDLDVSVRAAYRYYPLETQEDTFTITLPIEGMVGNLSTGYRLTRYVNGNIYDRFLWATDFVDTRGQQDSIGGRRFERIENVVGTDLTWLMGPDRNLGIDLSRRDVIVTDNDEVFEDQDRVEYRERIFYEQRVWEGIVLGAQAGFTQRDYELTNRNDTSQQDYSVYIRGSEQGIAGVRLTDASSFTASVGASVGKRRSSGSGRSTIDDTAIGGPATSGRTFSDSESSSLTAVAELMTQLSKIAAHRITYETGLRGGFDTDFEEYDLYAYELNLDREGQGIDIYSRIESVEPTTNDQNAYDAWVSGIRADYPLFGFLVLDGGWEYVVRENKRIVDSVNIENNEDYSTQRLRIGTGVQIMKDVAFRVNAERSERTSNDDRLDFTRDTYQATLSWSRKL